MGGAEGGQPSTPAEPVVCETLAKVIQAGTYSIRAPGSGKCLNPGDEPVPLKTPLPAEAPLLIVNDACVGAQWRVIASMTVETAFLFTHAVLSNAVVDVETAATEEGTRVVVYGFNDYNNQRFYIDERGAGTATFQIQPVHAEGMCLTRKPAGIEIWPCSARDDAQGWQFYSCPPAQ